MARDNSFLGLPAELRTKIYKLSGLVRFCPINILEGRRNEPQAALHRFHGDCKHCMYSRKLSGFPGRYTKRLYRSVECYCPSLPTQLLYVSRTVHDEAIAVLYGQNRFKVLPQSHEDLKVLQGLSDKALRAIKSLHVGLDPVDNQEYVAVDLGGTSAYALDENSVRGRETLHVWTALCKLVASHLTLPELHFSFSCEPQSWTAVAVIIEPLYSLPKVKDSAVRLGSLHTLSTDQQKIRKDMSKELVSFLTGQPITTHGSFPFAKLPREIRKMVLQHTDLVVKRDVTQWLTDGILVSNGRIQPRKRCCGRCTDALESCCCPVRVAGFSQRCRCWQTPSALLYVSREVCADALEILYSQNRFVFTEDALAMLSKLPTSSLKSMRTLDFKVFDMDMSMWSISPDELYVYWSRLTHFINDNLLVSKLWISIDLSEMWDDSVPSGNLEWVLSVYQKIISHWRNVKGLQRFHVFLRFFHEHEVPLEREVMGETYDSAAEGKPSDWRRRTWGYPHRRPSRDP